MKSFLVATIKPWNVNAYHEHADKLEGDWHLITEKKKLDGDFLKRLNPRYIFFPHWSWRVPKEIIENYECVCFHMTDLPYGRGGTPLQNLIYRGHCNTKVCAIKMTASIDAGPIYIKSDLSLSGRAHDIYKNLSEVVFSMIREISETHPCPSPQSGNPTFLNRRTPAESEVPKNLSSKKLYDHIRMTDAPTYPLSFVNWGDWKLEFSEAELLRNGDVSATVRFKKNRGK